MSYEEDTEVWSDWYIERWNHGDWASFSELGFRGLSGDEADEAHRVTGKQTGYEWNVDCSFDEVSEAIEAAEAFRKKHPSVGQLRVISDEGEVAWSENYGYATVVESSFEMKVSATLNLKPQEESMIEQQPLHVPREALIETLQANLDAEKAERQKAQDAITARRQAAQDAVASLSPDELLNLVQKYVAADLDNVVAMVDDAHKTGRLKSSEQKAGPKESSLEKWVRVLALANDDTIEVAPTDPVYALL